MFDKHLTKKYFWEQRKLREIVKSHQAGIYINKAKYGQGTNIIGVQNFYENDSVDGKVYRLAPVHENKYFLHTNDLIYSESSLVLSGIARTLYVTSKGNNTAFAWHTRKYVVDNQLVDSAFLSFDMDYNQRIRNHLMSTATQTALAGITTNDYFNTLLKLPNRNEQKSISDLIENINNLVKLQQRKNKLLNRIKEALLQRMFASENQKFPDLRFKEFCEEWERRRLGDIANIVTGGDKDRQRLSKSGKYPVIANSINTNGIIGYYSHQYRITAPAITVTGRGDIGHAKARFVNFTPVVRLLALTTKHNVIFLSHAINSIRIFNESTGVPQLTKPQLSNYKVSITNIKEENSIGLLLKKLKNCITLQKQTMKNLQSVKRFLLQNMFI